MLLAEPHSTESSRDRLESASFAHAVELFDEGQLWLSRPAGEQMKKINTHQFYRLAIAIHPLVDLRQEDTTLSPIFSALWRAKYTLRPYLSGSEDIIPDSSKRAASALIAAITTAGLVDDVGGLDFEKSVPAYRVGEIIQKARDFETVVANDLPGMDTYHVYPKGIYSTSALIDVAEQALLDGLSEVAKTLIPAEVLQDFNQAGRCLAFELPTASAFHTMRAVEGLLRSYWRLVKNAPASQHAPMMATCISDLRTAGEDPGTLSILDHIRELNRNPVMHPEVFLDLKEALRLFDISKSALSAMAARIEELVNDAAATAAAAAAGLASPGSTPATSTTP